VAIEPKTRADQEKMDDGLNRLTEEDPTFNVNYDDDTGQTIISGMGELHLEVLVDRLLSEFGIEAKVGKPEVAYRETITVPVQAEGRFVRQSGGRGQYGHIWLQLEPVQLGCGYQFVDQVKGGVIPKEYIMAAEAGIREAMESGVLGGYTLVDVKVTIYDGSYHEVDSSPLAFKIAGSMALRNAVKKGKPILLEPIMQLEVVAPGEFLGDIINDLSSRRGHIGAIETRYAGMCIIRSLIPLAEAFGYASSLRSITQGRATHSLEPYRYQELPVELSDRLLNKVIARK
jgi:elongation factor G